MFHVFKHTQTCTWIRYTHKGEKEVCVGVGEGLKLKVNICWCIVYEIEQM